MEKIGSLLTLSGIRKEYSEFTLQDISFNVPMGQVFGIIGPNGAGKSTTIKMIMNMTKPTAGEISVFGLKYPDDEKEIKNRIGYVGEEQYFYGNKTVDWTAKFVSQYYRNWDKNKFDRFLMDFKISRAKKTEQLSKGMKVKLSLAIALSHNPELIILDEPTAGLDPIVRREVLDLLSNVVLDGDKSVVISSHITDDLARIADFVTFMIEGRIVLFGQKDDLLADWKKVHFKKDTLNESVRNSLISVQETAFASSGMTNNYRKLEGVLESEFSDEDVKVENVSLDDILISFVEGM